MDRSRKCPKVLVACRTERWAFPALALCAKMPADRAEHRENAGHAGQPHHVPGLDSTQVDASLSQRCAIRGRLLGSAATGPPRAWQSIELDSRSPGIQLDAGPVHRCRDFPGTGETGFQCPDRCPRCIGAIPGRCGKAPCVPAGTAPPEAKQPVRFSPPRIWALLINRDFQHTGGGVAVYGVIVGFETTQELESTYAGATDQGISRLDAGRPIPSLQRSALEAPSKIGCTMSAVTTQRFPRAEAPPRTGFPKQQPGSIQCGMWTRA